MEDHDINIDMLQKLYFLYSFVTLNCYLGDKRKFGTLFILSKFAIQNNKRRGEKVKFQNINIDVLPKMYFLYSFVP